jgi:hypothetical protein
MPIKMIYNKKPSNKRETLPENPPKAPSPFIDKISVVLDPASERDAQDIHAELFPILEDAEVFKNAGKGAKWGPYKVAKRLKLPNLVDPKKYPLLQYAYSGKKAEQLRLEFVPVDLGWHGMAELHASLGMVDGGWGYFIKHGRITRLDVTVDIPGVRMDDFLFLPQQALTTMQWNVDGHLQSLVFGKKSGNQTSIYSRNKKRLAKGQSWSGEPEVRIERRLANLKQQKVSSLPSLSNPFTAMQITLNLPGPPPDGKAWEWSMFADSVKVRGLCAALALLPEERRTKYRKHLAAHPQPWWNPDAIWAQWPAMLDELKIATAETWLT